ncbi:MAG: ABC transporter ATP-binding protein [Brotaphodocola sp.]
MTEYYFTAENMCVGYDREPLIRNMEIRLKKGEILTLIGPNGAGKSTILKSIARQLKLIDGVIFLDKRKLSEFSGKELSQTMSVVLTEKIHTEMMTCEDVVATGRYPYTGRFGILSKTDEQIVKEAMELVHVMEIRDQDFTRISDGQRQRVMLARAICQEPEIIILDEPTSHLDIKYKLEFLTILQEMRRKKGLTVIMSLHELELAERISDKVLCIHGEQPERFGTPEEVFDADYIARLFSISADGFDAADRSVLRGGKGTISCSERIIEKVISQWQK